MPRVTIGRRWPRSAPRGDSTAMCAHCGANWRRSQLHRDADGLLTCPDEGTGATTSELSAANAAAASDWAANRVTPRSDPMDTDDGSVTPPQRTTLEDIE